MKYLISALISLIISVNVAFAHGGGHAPIKESQVIEYADKNIAIVVDQEIEIAGSKLDKSWLNIPASNKKIFKKGQGYYIVSLKDDKSNKTLYILLSKAGELYDANYNGKFEDL